MPLCPFGHFIADEWADCAACDYEEDMARRRKSEMAYIRRTAPKKDCAAGKHRIPINDDQCRFCVLEKDYLHIRQAHASQLAEAGMREELRLRQTEEDRYLEYMANRHAEALADKATFRAQAFPNGVPNIHQIKETSTGRIMTFIIGPKIKPRPKRGRKRARR